MNLISQLIDLVLHIDKHIGWIIQNFGAGVYLILFLVIFCETGLVFTPFLPGDSLLFVAGTFAALGSMNLILLFLVVAAAAILGDTANYWIGHYFGEKVLLKTRFVKKEYLAKTKEFYRKHGGKTIILARFIPIIRTFAPFVAGIGRMSYLKFISYNIIGGLLWVTLFVFAGYFFGSLPIVKDNLAVVIFAIIFLSFLPPVIEYLKEKRKARKNEAK